MPGNPVLSFISFHSEVLVNGHRYIWQAKEPKRIHCTEPIRIGCKKPPGRPRREKNKLNESLHKRSAIWIEPSWKMHKRKPQTISVKFVSCLSEALTFGQRIEKHERKKKTQNKKKNRTRTKGRERGAKASKNSSKKKEEAIIIVHDDGSIGKVSDKDRRHLKFVSLVRHKFDQGTKSGQTSKKRMSVVDQVEKQST